MSIHVVNKELVNFAATPKVNFVLIDRTTLWGNPYKIDAMHDRSMVLEMYTAYLIRQLERKGAYYREFLKLVDVYRKTNNLALVCHCKPLDCHGDILAEYLEIEAWDLT